MSAVEDWMQDATDQDRWNLAAELAGIDRLTVEFSEQLAAILIARQREPMAGDGIRVEFTLTKGQAEDALKAIRRAMGKARREEELRQAIPKMVGFDPAKPGSDRSERDAAQRSYDYRAWLRADCGLSFGEWLQQATP